MAEEQKETACDDVESNVIREKMDEDRFWALVDMIGWGQGGEDEYDYTTKKMMLMIELGSPEEACRMRNRLSAARSALAKKLEGFKKELDARAGHQRLTGDEQSAVNTWLGGDGWSDFTHHIIGLGREEYEKVLEDPIQGWLRASRGKYQESFAYCVPYSLDYNDLEVERYVEWAKRNIEELKNDVDHAKETLKDELVDKIRALIPLHEPMAEGDYEAFLSNAKKLRKLAEDAPIYHWGIWNLCTGVQRWLVDYPKMKEERRG